MKHANHEKVLTALAAEYERHSPPFGRGEPRSAAVPRRRRQPHDPPDPAVPAPDRRGLGRVRHRRGRAPDPRLLAGALRERPRPQPAPCSPNPSRRRSPPASACRRASPTGSRSRSRSSRAGSRRSERVRFTSSGSLATMYAVLLARAFTGRELVMKVGGGWHGAQPWGLVGVDLKEGDHASYQHAESKGLPGAVAERGDLHPVQRHGACWSACSPSTAAASRASSSSPSSGRAGSCPGTPRTSRPPASSPRSTAACSSSTR